MLGDLNKLNAWSRSRPDRSDGQREGMRRNLISEDDHDEH